MSTSPAPRSAVRRAVVLTVLAVLFAALTLAAAIEPRWIEELTGLEPDAGGGELEWLFAAIAGGLTVATGAGAGWSWRRVAAA